MKEIKERTPSESARRSKISVRSFISCVPLVASGKAERCGIVYSLCCYDFTEHEDTKKGRAAHRAKKLCVFVSLCSIKF